MDAVTQINVLEGLSDEEIARLVAICRESSHEAGATIFTEGDVGEDLYIVRTGRVRIAKAISLEVDRTLTRLGPGGVFGELAMVGVGSRSATAVCEEPTTILALAQDSFLTLTETEPGLGLKVMGRFAAMLADRLRVTTDLLRDTVSWGLEVSGAAKLDLHEMITARAAVVVALSNGERLAGRLLKVDTNEAGTLLTLSGVDSQLHLVPYHAVVAIHLDAALLREEV